MTRIDDQNRIAYDYLAEAYAKEWANNPDFALADQFLASLRFPARILDVGCGPGQYSHYFTKNGHRVVGIDISVKMISIARQRSNVDFRLLDMRNLDFPDGSFDALWVCASAAHIPKDEIPDVLKGFRRILSDSGVLFVNAIIGAADCRVETADEIGNGFEGKGRFFQWYPNSAAFTEILDEAGFLCEEISRKNVTSQVLRYAKCRTNTWCNYLCRLADSR